MNNYSEVLEILKTLTLTKNENLTDAVTDAFNSSVQVFQTKVWCIRSSNRTIIKHRLQCHRMSRRFVPYWSLKGRSSVTNVDESSFVSNPNMNSRCIGIACHTVANIHPNSTEFSEYFKELHKLVGVFNDDFDFDDDHRRPILLNCPNLNMNTVAATRFRSTRSCSAQARKPDSSPSSPSSATNTPTIGELAAYLDEYLYIPKKMSVMAENMYT